jgi:hypothetical protein
MKSQKVLLQIISIAILFFITTKQVRAEDLINREEIVSSITTAVNTESTTINNVRQSEKVIEDSSGSETINSEETNAADVTNESNANIDQQLNIVADSGNNEAERNISIGGDAGIISTGDASINASTIVDTNSNSISANTGNSDKNNEATALNQNTTDITKTDNLTANTGGNKADRNISIGGSAGVIKTGKASINTSTLINSNGTVMLVGGNNDGYGPGSGASIVVLDSFFINRFKYLTTKSNNTNQVYLTTALTTQAISGQNIANRNISFGGNAGVIKTGNAIVNLVSTVYANSNQTEFGHSSNSANQSSHVASVNAKAISGQNTANRNISFGGNAGVIETGNAIVNATTQIDTNTNINIIIPMPTPPDNNNPNPIPSPDPNPNPDPNPYSNPTNSNIPTISDNNSNNSDDSRGGVNLATNSTEPATGSVLGTLTSLPTTGNSALFLLNSIIGLLMFVVGSVIKITPVFNSYKSRKKGDDTK